tara:strand:+ start:1634 stop:1795 length:162 start_codon:yes stop_codon:yes gene_type:complete
MNIFSGGGKLLRSAAVGAVLCAASFTAWAQDAERPNILIIWGDDVGMWNITAA